MRYVEGRMTGSRERERGRDGGRMRGGREERMGNPMKEAIEGGKKG